jgi:hypothetical protein
MKTPMYTPQSEVPDSERSSYENQLIGVWRLVKYTDEHEDSDHTQPFGPNPQGFLIYTADGFVSAQLMKPGRPAFHSADWHHGTPCAKFRETAPRPPALTTGGLLLSLLPLRKIFLGQRRSGRLGLHHDARNSPAAGFFDRLNAVDAARDLLAVAKQRVAAP